MSYRAKNLVEEHFARIYHVWYKIMYETLWTKSFQIFSTAHANFDLKTQSPGSSIVRCKNDARSERWKNSTDYLILTFYHIWWHKQIWSDRCTLTFLQIISNWPYFKLEVKFWNGVCKSAHKCIGYKEVLITQVLLVKNVNIFLAPLWKLNA